MVVFDNEHFKYPVLSHPDSIRMLTLARLDDDGALRAHLSCARLCDRPKFSALSYVWGETSPEDPSLMINGQPYQVTRSFHAAVSYLASSGNNSNLWIDQISINQEDDTEKNSTSTADVEHILASSSRDRFARSSNQKRPACIRFLPHLGIFHEQPSVHT